MIRFVHRSAHAYRSLVRTFTAACLLPLLGVASGAHADGDDAALKAAFIYHFSQLVEWPGDTPAEVVVGVMGNDGLRDALTTLVEEKGAGDTVSVRGFGSAEDAIAQAHILIVGTSQADNVVQILEAVAGEPILTVGDVESFAGNGGIIGFVRRGTRQKFEVNLSAADGAGLQLKSQLLQVAILVD